MFGVAHEIQNTVDRYDVRNCVEATRRLMRLMVLALFAPDE
jgi:hypothetical protein